MQTTGQKFTKYTLVGTAGLATLLITFKTIKKSLNNSRAEGAKYSTDKYVRWAAEIYSALHGSFFYEDEEAIYKVGLEMCGTTTDFENTSKEYKKMYDLNMLIDMQNWLNSYEMNQFATNLNRC